MMGRILKFFKRKNYGFIIADSIYFFTISDCDNYEGYNIGDLVDFDVRGERAVNVTKNRSLCAVNSIYQLHDF